MPACRTCRCDGGGMAVVQQPSLYLQFLQRCRFTACRPTCSPTLCKKHSLPTCLLPACPLAATSSTFCQLGSAPPSFNTPSPTYSLSFSPCALLQPSLGRQHGCAAFRHGGGRHGTHFRKFCWFCFAVRGARGALALLTVYVLVIGADTFLRMRFLRGARSGSGQRHFFTNVTLALWTNCQFGSRPFQSSGLHSGSELSKTLDSGPVPDHSRPETCPHPHPLPALSHPLSSHQFCLLLPPSLPI